MSNIPAIIFNKPNKVFLEHYQPYLKKSWQEYYFQYDKIKEMFHEMSKQAHPDLKRFDMSFYKEVRRVDRFLETCVNEIENNLSTIGALNNHSMELFIRELFERSIECEKFFELNFYVICKMAKKFEKLIEKHSPSFEYSEYQSLDYINNSFAFTMDGVITITKRCIEMYSKKFRQFYPALTYGELKFVKNKVKDTSITKFMIGLKLGIICMMLAWIITDSYTVTSTMPFWQHPALFVYTTIGNLLLYRVLYAANTSLWHFFKVNYLTIFDLPHDIKPNFFSILNNASSQFVLLFVNLLLFFEFNVNQTTIDDLYGHNVTLFLCNGFPILLVVTALFYEIYESISYKIFSNKTSRGLFTAHIIMRCLVIFLVHSPISFHESYVANLMTTFTKVYSDFLHALCWIISGSFISSGQTVSAYGSDYMNCKAIEWDWIICVCQIFPQIIRILQQYHTYLERPESQFLVNTFKYVLTIVVVLYGMFEKTYTGPYLALTVLLAVFKAIWDIYVNWGLFDTNPSLPEIWNYWKSCYYFYLAYVTYLFTQKHQKIDNDIPVSDKAYGTIFSTKNEFENHATIFDSNIANSAPEMIHVEPPNTPQTVTAEQENKPQNGSQNVPPNGSQNVLKNNTTNTTNWFLRKELMYQSPWFYYCCMIANFILRFLWAMSLFQGNTFLGTKFNLFLASMEIIRRSLWGLLRVEFEHIRYNRKNIPGYLLQQKFSNSVRPTARTATGEDSKMNDLEANTLSGRRIAGDLYFAHDTVAVGSNRNQYLPLPVSLNSTDLPVDRTDSIFKSETNTCSLTTDADSIISPTPVLVGPTTDDNNNSNIISSISDNNIKSCNKKSNINSNIISTVQKNEVEMTPVAAKQSKEEMASSEHPTVSSSDQYTLNTITPPVTSIILPTVTTPATETAAVKPTASTATTSAPPTQVATDAILPTTAITVPLQQTLDEDIGFSHESAEYRKLSRSHSSNSSNSFHYVGSTKIPLVREFSEDGPNWPGDSLLTSEGSTEESKENKERYDNVYGKDGDNNECKIVDNGDSSGTNENK